ncbi:hypothetical protein Bbelb_200140 [Branchiostoma belcheri]|nr:hypothetical protein Bbelb_200140 [Branchiostoma belcheri]
MSDSSTEGVIRLMEHTHQFVPETDRKLSPVMCCWDGLSVERMIHCKWARANGETRKARLEGLVEGPQEFHKEIILFQSKAYFQHKSLKRNVQENVQHVWDMKEVRA